MLTPLHHTTGGPRRVQFSLLEALLEEPFPRTPEDLLELERRLSTAAGQIADQIVLVQLTRAHEDEAFVRRPLPTCVLKVPCPSSTRDIVRPACSCSVARASSSRRPTCAKTGAAAGGVAATNGAPTGRAATRCWRPWASPTE